MKENADKEYIKELYQDSIEDIKGTQIEPDMEEKEVMSDTGIEKETSLENDEKNEDMGENKSSKCVNIRINDYEHMILKMISLVSKKKIKDVTTEAIKKYIYEFKEKNPTIDLNLEDLNLEHDKIDIKE